MEPLKTKYAKETTEAFKKMIKTKQPKKVWVDKGTEFKGEFKKLCIKREIIKYNTHKEKNSSSKLVQKPKFYVGDYVRIAKTDLPFRKGYKQIFTDKVFEIVAIPTVNPPTYSLIDAEKEEIKGKFYEKEFSLIGNKADYNENGQ